MPGGKRPGAGRKKKLVQSEMLAFAREKAMQGMTPLEYMLAVLRNPNNSPTLRLEAAKAAAPYVHPRLAQIEHKPADGAEGQIVFLGGVLASPAPMIEMQKLDS